MNLIESIRNSQPAVANGFDVIDRHTGLICGHFATLRRAHLFADRKDSEYGAVRYTVQRAPSFQVTREDFCSGT